MNVLGKLYTFNSFGESHGAVIGGVIDGCPAGIAIDEEFVQKNLNQRRPGQSTIATSRQEDDQVEFLSGIFEGKSLGSPIAFVIHNKDQRSNDYEQLKNVYRPSHGDYTYQKKYGIRDYRGGGRSSARTTAGWIVAGAVGKLILQRIGVEIRAYTSQIGGIAVNAPYQSLNLDATYTNAVRCPDEEVAKNMIEYVKNLKGEGDSVGGIVTCVVKGVPAGWGEPLFDKMEARLAGAMLSINAAHGFDYGAGFENVHQTGAALNDAFTIKDGEVRTTSNHSGGIQGGISNGEDIYFRVMFKPTPTIAKAQNTVDVAMNSTVLEAHGRHDPCVVPRAVAIVEAMTAITLADLALMANATRF